MSQLSIFNVRETITFRGSSSEHDQWLQSFFFFWCVCVCEDRERERSCWSLDCRRQGASGKKKNKSVAGNSFKAVGRKTLLLPPPFFHTTFLSIPSRTSAGDEAPCVKEVAKRACFHVQQPTATGSSSSSSSNSSSSKKFTTRLSLSLSPRFHFVSISRG